MSDTQLSVKVVEPGGAHARAVDHVYFVNPATHGDAEDIIGRAGYEDGETVLFVNTATVTSVTIEGNTRPTDFDSPV